MIGAGLLRHRIIQAARGPVLGLALTLTLAGTGPALARGPGGGAAAASAASAGAGVAPSLPVQTLDRAELAPATDTATGAREAVPLPHVLPKEQVPQKGTRVHYHLRLDLQAAPAEPLGIFIDRVSRSGRVFVNGHEVGSCAPGPLETLRCVRHPVWLQVPPELWRAGSNDIEIEVFANRMQLNGLSPVVVGPAATVYDRHYQPTRLVRQDLPLALQWALFAIGLISLMVGALHRAEGRHLFLWFGLACMLRGISMFYAVIVDVWLDMLLTQWLFTAARLTSIPVMLLVLLALSDKRWRWLERLLAGYAMVLPVAALLVGARVEPSILLAMPGVLVGIGLLGVTAWRAWRRRSRTDALLAATVVVLLVAGMHDTWALARPGGFLQPQLLPFANSVLLLVLGGLIMTRLTRALTTEGNVNTILKERIGEAEANLERQHRTIVDLERRAARMEERERLLRDLHDGMGSSLSTARIRLEAGAMPPAQLRELLDDCIDDLRLLLDTSEPEGELADALGNLRHRITQRLQGSPLSLSWEMALDGMPAVPAHAKLQVLRILQEALTNALRHSGARRIQVRAVHDAVRGQLALDVEDDGRWLSQKPGQPEPLPTGGGGRGLTNMRLRAARLGAQFTLASDERGTRVRLEWTTDQA